MSGKEESASEAHRKVAKTGEWSEQSIVSLIAW
jgi:hypothetical protein